MKKRFIFDESFNKKYGKKDNLKWLIVGVVVLIFILLLIILVIANKKPKKPNIVEGKPVFELKEELVVEAGNGLPEVADYFKKLENVDIKDVKIGYPEDFEISYDNSYCSDEDKEKMNEGASIEDFSCVEKTLKSPATYGVSVTIQDKEYTVRVIVNDTSAPILRLKDVEIYSGNNYDISDFVAFCVDATGSCETLFYDKDVDEAGNIIDYGKYTEPGEYKVRIYAKDGYDNVTEPMEVNLKILQPESVMYIVKFNSNGGTEVSEVKVPEGNTVTEPTPPTRDGYTFVGWYVGNDKFDFTAGIDKNITLTAKWNKNGGSGTTNPPPVNPGDVTVKSIVLNFKKINLVIGESKTVSVSVYPSNATNKTVSWASKDNSIATVSNGQITGVKAGTTTITATAGGKSASVEVVVREKSSSTCAFGDANYNTDFILSVNLIQNNCAVNPNGTYNEINSVVAKDYSKATNDLIAMGLSTQANYFEHKERYVNVKNTAGTGLVGVQITMTLTVIDPDNPYIAMTAEYIIKSDGTRQFIKNNIKKNGVSFK